MRRLHPTLVLLSFGAGAADAFAFLALNGTFTANMTGNLVLAAMFTKPGFEKTFICAVVAIAVFAVVLYSGFRLTKGSGHGPDSPRYVMTVLLIPSLVAQLVVIVVWLFIWKDAPLAVVCVVIAFSAAALALQTVAAKKLSDVDGITTTYVTGTLTTTMQALAERKDSGQGMRVLSILALPAGAVAATALYQLAGWCGPMLPFVVTAVATLVAFSARPAASPSSGAPQAEAPSPPGAPGV